MIHSSNKKAIKRDSRTFSCQGGHKNFITPTTLKENKLHWRLFAGIPDDAKIEEKDFEDDEMTVTAHKVVIAGSPTAEAMTPHTTTPSASTLVSASASISVTTPTTNATTGHTVTPSASTPASALPSLEKDTANQVLRNLQADYQDLLGKDAKNSDKLEDLQSKLSELSKDREDPCRLQQKYNDLLERHQSLIIQTMDPKGLVLRAINLPFDHLEDFDGLDAVIGDTYVKKQKKVTKFVTMLTQSNFLDGLVRNEIVKQAKSIIRDEQYTPWKILRLKDKHGGKLSLETIDILRSLETNDKKYVKDTILCGSSTIKRVALIVKRFADSFIPYHISSLAPEHGKGEVIS
jgi:hypothetical protein